MISIRPGTQIRLRTKEEMEYGEAPTIQGVNPGVYYEVIGALIDQNNYLQFIYIDTTGKVNYLRSDKIIARVRVSKPLPPMPEKPVKVIEVKNDNAGKDTASATGSVANGSPTEATSGAGPTITEG